MSNFCLLLVIYYVFWPKIRSKSLLFHCFQLKSDDVVFDCIVMNFFLYYLTPYQNLLRLNVIFMVRKIGQLLFSRGGGLPPPALSLCLILGPRW